LASRQDAHRRRADDSERRRAVCGREGARERGRRLALVRRRRRSVRPPRRARCGDVPRAARRPGRQGRRGRSRDARAAVARTARTSSSLSAEVGQPTLHRPADCRLGLRPVSERPLSATATFEQRLARVWESAPDEAGWVTTTDHKRIGERYIVTAFLFFVLGGIEALVLRAQLARPEIALVDPATYDALFTMHGT